MTQSSATDEGRAAPFSISLSARRSNMPTPAEVVSHAKQGLSEVVADGAALAKTTMKESQAAAKEKYDSVSTALHGEITNHPARYFGVVLGIGFVLGVLVARR
jgi:ElaB/YqjD/DUF883 family membrane-anchored ribosome-binding protein